MSSPASASPASPASGSSWSACSRSSSSTTRNSRARRCPWTARPTAWPAWSGGTSAPPCRASWRSRCSRATTRTPAPAGSSITTCRAAATRGTGSTRSDRARSSPPAPSRSSTRTPSPARAPCRPACRRPIIPPTTTPPPARPDRRGTSAVTMPFYVSPEQSMKDKADYARKAIARIRSGVVITCEAGILFVAPNPSRALRKFSEIYDRIAFAAVGRYNEFERLRQAGVRYADLTGFQYDRQDVTPRGLANFYAQALGTFFTDSPKPYEVELVVAEVGKTADDEQIYRITFDGSVADERGFVVMGGQADQVAAVLKEQYSEGMTLGRAFDVAIAARRGQGNGDRQ